MNINEGFTFLNFISNKNQSGTVTPSQFNQLADRAQMEFFEKDYAQWQLTQDITDALSVFLKSLATSVPTDGRLIYPSDYLHTSSMRHYFVFNNGGGKEVSVEEVDNLEFGQRTQSEIVIPTLRHPIYTDYADYMQFEPKNIGLITMDYFRQPTSPVWGFTLVNNRPVYNAATSTDWELPNETHSELVAIMASYLGINLRENDLIQYAELQKKELIND